MVARDGTANSRWQCRQRTGRVEDEPNMPTGEQPTGQKKDRRPYALRRAADPWWGDAVVAFDQSSEAGLRVNPASLLSSPAKADSNSP